MSDSPVFAPPVPAPRPAWRRVLRWTVLVLFGGLVISWVLARFETQQLYYPTPLRGETPAQWGLSHEDVQIATEDGITLQAWWVARPEGVEPGSPLVINLHGNAGNREDRLPVLRDAWRENIPMLIVDYRGYGGSGGAPTENGLYTDGIAAYDWLAARYPGHPIVVYGHSLGSAVAAHVAMRRPAAAVILESPFTSAPDMAERVFPVPGIRHVVRSRFDTLAVVRGITAPLLVIHGERDEIVPFEMGRTVFEAAASPAKVFRAIPNGRHNDGYVVAGKQYWEWVREFMRGVSGQ